MNKKLLPLAVLLLLPLMVLAGYSMPALGVASAAPSAPQALSAGTVFDALELTLGEIYEQVTPSVVNIQVVGEASALPQDHPVIPGFPSDPSLPQEPLPQQGLGSGFVWDEEGHVVTNNHVIAGAQEIRVTFSDDTTVPAEVVGTDPHSFDPSPQDVARIVDADVIYANGAGLEIFIEDLLESAGAHEKIVYVSDGADLIWIEEDEELHEEEDAHSHEEMDPHTWMDPGNVVVWADNILESLRALDPVHTQEFQRNADSYQETLEELDQWVIERVSEIPEADRLIVTDHTQFSYFARAYGFTQVGAIIPGASSLAEPSAKELAALEDAVSAMGVKAIFVGNTVNPSLAERVAEDTGTKLVMLYTGSLSDPGGEAGTYTDYIKYNVKAIVDALK